MKELVYKTQFAILKGIIIGCLIGALVGVVLGSNISQGVGIGVGILSGLIIGLTVSIRSLTKLRNSFIESAFCKVLSLRSGTEGHHTDCGSGSQLNTSKPAPRIG